MPSLPSRALAALLVTGLVAGGIVAVAVAQTDAPPPIAKFTLGAKKSLPTGPATLPAGSVRFVVGTKAKGDHSFLLIRVADGADIVALQARARTITSEDEFEAVTELSAVGGGEVTAQSRGDSVFTLKPGRYLLVDGSDEKVSPNIPITVAGDPATAPKLPAASATVSLSDFKYTVTGTLPRNGVVRLVNKGKRNHMLINFKAQNAAGAARMIKALKTGKEKAFQKEIRGTGPSVPLVGPGEPQNLKFSTRPGSYVFVCFWESKQSGGKSHFTKGMIKAVTVK